MYIHFLYGLAFDCVCVRIWEQKFLEHNVCSGEFTCCSNSIDLLSKLFFLFRWCNISPDIIAKLLGIPLLLVFAFPPFFLLLVLAVSRKMDLSYLLAWFRFVHIKRLEYCNVSNEIDFVIGLYLRKCVCNWNDIIIPYFIHSLTHC